MHSAVHLAPSSLKSKACHGLCVSVKAAQWRIPHFVGAPPSGRFWVVCKGDRDGGVAPTRGWPPSFVGAPPSGRWVVVCEGDRDGGVAPTRGWPPHFVGAPPSGRFWVVCEGDRDEGVAPTRGWPPSFVGAPPSGRFWVVCKAPSRRGRDKNHPHRPHWPSLSVPCSH
jgi:hypothetical protein